MISPAGIHNDYDMGPWTPAPYVPLPSRPPLRFIAGNAAEYRYAMHLARLGDTIILATGIADQGPSA